MKYALSVQKLSECVCVRFLVFMIVVPDPSGDAEIAAHAVLVSESTKENGSNKIILQPSYENQQLEKD